MANYLIEISHDENKMACMKAMQVFIDSGSHLLANADWGCEDNEHKAWMLVDTDTKDQALQVIPPLYRHNAKIIKLIKLSKEEVDYYRKTHKLKETDKYHD
jgi:hypothetical protein